MIFTHQHSIFADFMWKNVEKGIDFTAKIMQYSIVGVENTTARRRLRPAFLPLLIFCVFYRLEVYSVAYMRLGDLLVSSGIITGEQLEQALALPREDGQRLGDVLIRQGVISEAQLIDALRVQLGVDFVDLTAVSIPVELAKYVPRNLAKKFLVVPVKLVQDRLYLAMHDPLDFVAQDEVKTASRKRIIPMIATRKAVEQAIERLYGSEGTARVIEEMKREAGAGEDIIPAQMARDTADPEASAPTIRFVNSLIERAFTERASDIHLEPQEGEMLVRMRIDGLL